MEITAQALIASVFKLQSKQLIKAEGYTQDPTSCFIKKHANLGRTIEIFLDYDESNTIQARVQQARERSAKLRCEAADVDTVMPMMLKHEERNYAVMMVLHHRFVNHRWDESMDIYYPDESVKGLLFDLIQAWFPQTNYMNSSSLVYHHPSPLASLLALVCAYTLHYQTRLAVNYYSPAYAKHMKQLVHLLYPQEDAAPIQSLAYHMIRHAGRHYERPLAELMDICITVPQHKRLFECLDTLLTYTLNLCADPNAASIIADQAERFDPHQRKRAAITILMAATTVALLLIAGLGVMGPGLILQSGVGSASLTAGAVCMAYLWRRSEYRPPPVSIALKNLSIAVKIPLAGVPALPPL